MRTANENLRAEFRAALEGLQTSGENLRSELRTAIALLQAADESLRLEMRTANENLRAEFRSQIKAAFEEERADRRASELRSTQWIVGAIFAAVTLGVAAIKLIP